MKLTQRSTARERTRNSPNSSGPVDELRCNRKGWGRCDYLLLRQSFEATFPVHTLGRLPTSLKNT
jgi:hypothetical protein